jgi:hypothetical protein
MYVCVRDCEGVVVWLLLEKYVLSFHFWSIYFWM